jgi:hypothetical protein
MANRLIIGEYSLLRIANISAIPDHARADVIAPAIGPIYAPDFSPILPGGCS